MACKVWMTLGLWVLAVQAVAAETAGEHGASEQPNLFGGDLGNAIWTLLIFVLVLAVLGKFAWKPMLDSLHKREKYIRESLEHAKHDRETAEQRLAEYEQKIRDAQEQASAIVEEGRRDADAVKKRIQDESRKNADEILERAKREIDIARDSVLKDLYDQSAELAMNMAGAVLKRQLTPEDHTQLVQEALGELQKQPGSVN